MDPHHVEPEEWTYEQVLDAIERASGTQVRRRIEREDRRLFETWQDVSEPGEAVRRARSCNHEQL